MAKSSMRVCAQRGCRTRLSRYNRSPTCWIHTAYRRVGGHRVPGEVVLQAHGGPRLCISCHMAFGKGRPPKSHLCRSCTQAQQGPA